MVGPVVMRFRQAFKSAPEFMPQGAAFPDSVDFLIDVPDDTGGPSRTEGPAVDAATTRAGPLQQRHPAA